MGPQPSPPWLDTNADGIRIRVRAVPGARTSAIADTGSTELRLRLAAPPVDGKANTELQRFLGKTFKVRRTAVAITSGATARIKTVVITGDVDSLTALALAL